MREVSVKQSGADITFDDWSKEIFITELQIQVKSSTAFWYHIRGQDQVTNTHRENKYLYRECCYQIPISLKVSNPIIMCVRGPSINYVLIDLIELVVCSRKFWSHNDCKRYITVSSTLLKENQRKSPIPQWVKGAIHKLRFQPFILIVTLISRLVQMVQNS